MRKRLSILLVLVLLAGVVLSACGDGARADFQVGMVTDIGGIDDRSFNETSWAGVEMAEDELGVQGDFLVSQAQTDYGPNITQFINQGYDLIITVGFLLADATRDFAEANPDISFAIVDFVMDPPIDNVRSLSFATDEAGFLAGYAAAAATETGTVACFGGIQIPTVTIFMVGFEQGVFYYNEQNGTDVEVLGWNTADGTGVFVGNFESTDDGRRVGDEFLAEGADIIMPVAGPVGLGTAQAAQEAGDAWVIGVDTDWTVSAPEYADVILTSVVKRMDNAVFDTIELASSPDFEGFGGEVYVGTLDNEGVGISDVAAGTISDEVQSDLDDLRQAIIDGEINTGWDDYLASQ